MSDETYVVVEVPGLRTPGIDFSATHAGCIIDLASVRLPASAAGEPVMDAVMLVRDAGRGLPQLLRTLEEAYGRITTLERTTKPDAWLASFRYPVSALASPGIRQIAGFLMEHGVSMSWVRIEEGQTFIRSQTPPDTSGAALADQLRGFLEALRIEASVAVETASPGDSGPWSDLVDRVRQQAARYAA